MNIPFEQIQQALGAAIRGEEMRPVVSQRTLFGIPSSVETQMAKFAAEIAHEQSSSSQEQDACVEELREAIICVASEAGSKITIGRGMRYFIIVARNEGFDIPAYPFDPKGEFKGFLKASQSKNLPEWYESIGIPQSQYQQLQNHALLVVQSDDEKKRAFLVKGAEYCNPSKFEPLSNSRAISLGNRECLESIANALEIAIPKPE